MIAYNTGLVLLYWAVFLTVAPLVHWIYNVSGWKPETWGWFDTYPFKCYKCMATWTLIAAYWSVGTIMTEPGFTILGTVMSALYGYGLYLTEEERKVNNN